MLNNLILKKNEQKCHKHILEPVFIKPMKKE